MENQRKFVSKKSISKAIAIFLIGLIALNINVNTATFANSFNSDDFIYVSANENKKSEVTVDVNNAKEIVNINQVNEEEFRNMDSSKCDIVAIDGNLAENKLVKTKLIDLFNKGKKVIILKNNINLKQIYQYYGVSGLEEYTDAIDKDKADLLEVEGIGLSKGSDV